MIMVSRFDKRRDSRTSVSCPLYYSDGDFHASGMTENLTNRGGCLRGTHQVTVGTQLLVLLVPIARHALLIKKATVRWVGDGHFGVELNEVDCGIVGELGETHRQEQRGPISMLTQ
jgi:hypothetical protein